MARTPWRVIATLTLGLLWGLSHAQDNDPYMPDPPDRAARLSYIEGDVSMQPAGEQEWAQAFVNRPLTTGDKVWSEQNARAEIQVGPAAVRLGSNTGFSFLNVNDETIQMRITAGVLYVSVHALGGGEHIEIDTPNVALSLLRAGNYRVEVDDAGDHTVVKVSEGAVQATGPSQDVVVHDQQVVTFTGVDSLVAQYGTLGAPDEFDSWNLDRDRRDEHAENSRTAEYVAPDVTGYQDLEDNGSWSSEPEYGNVWTPTYVAAGWAPYQYGRWVWVSPWGWSWVDDARWGYAPFHYGRWAHVRNRWCWVPGPRHMRAVYAPALVGWVGSPGASVSWFPLGPREVYVPGRHFSRHYMERVNFTNTYVNRRHVDDAFENRIKDAVYRNRVVPGGVTTVSQNAFASANRTGDHRMRLREQDQASATASAVAPRIAPLRESRLGAPPRAHVRVPPQTVADRQVVVRRDPPSAVAHFARPPAQTERPARPVRDSRTDSPQRTEQPRTQFASPVQTSVRDPGSIADRVREVRDRQVHEQLRQAVQQQEQQREQQEHQERERAQREPQQHERPAQRERHTEPPRVEQPRVEQPRAERPEHSETHKPDESRSPPRTREGGNTRTKRD